MLSTLPFLAAATTMAGTVAGLVRYWILTRHRIVLAREHGQTLLRVLSQLKVGYDLEHQAPDGSRWLVRPSPAGPDSCERGTQ